MRAIIVSLATLCATLFGATASFANVTSVTYLANLFFPVERVQILGWITTDGNLGILATSDIVSINLIASGPTLGLEYIPQNTTLSLIGDDLIATPRDLTFAYGANDGGIFSFQQKFVDPGTLFWCNATGGQNACSQGISLFGFPPNEASVNLSETLVLASAPEPATWSLMLIGFVGLGFMGWQSQQNRATAAI
jgi:hypothetical protein